ncbi:MAG: hypothetical protein O2783_06480, partial [Chloroflexi bacterium]|nr:hypothetical protein [Chloroflexota bacterium]
MVVVTDSLPSIFSCPGHHGTGPKIHPYLSSEFGKLPRKYSKELLSIIVDLFGQQLSYHRVSAQSMVSYSELHTIQDTPRHDVLANLVWCYNNGFTKSDLFQDSVHHLG